MNKILDFPTKYLIWSVEHEGWWKQNCHGYSPTLADAGLFEKEEAEKIVKEANSRGRLEECMIPKGAFTNG